jgi:ankyrin repeat protein
MGLTDRTNGKSLPAKSLLLGLPNELFGEVASNLPNFGDLNSLVRTSGFFHNMFNTDLYRRAVAADDAVLNEIVGWVLSSYQLASLTLLLDHGLSVNHTGKFDDDRYTGKESMLHFLCKLDDPQRSVPLARLLIQRGADMEARAAILSETVLYRAIWFGNCPIVAVLIAHGVDLNAPDLNGIPPLHLASHGKKDNPEMIHLLIAHGADIEGRTSDGNTPLNLVEPGYARVMAALLEHGADAGVHNDFGETPLHHASTWLHSEHHELAKSLLEHGAIVNAIDENGETPLHWAIKDHEVDDGLFMTKFLLENGADVNTISNHEPSALRCLCSGCERGLNPHVAALLHEYGAGV